jgi:hypothetical protein
MALLPSESFLSGLTSKENAIYLQQNHRYTIEALRRSNLFTAIDVEIYDKVPDQRPAGPDTLIFCCDWALYTRGNEPAGQPLPFDFTIEQRDRRINQWIDAIEGTLVAQAAALGAFRVQVAAVDSRAGAEATWTQLQKKHPQLLGDLHLTVVEITKNSGKMYRVQGGPFPDRAAAVDACMALKAAKQNCLVAKPEGPSSGVAIRDKIIARWSLDAMRKLAAEKLGARRTRAGPGAFPLASPPHFSTKPRTVVSRLMWVKGL